MKKVSSLVITMTVLIALIIGIIISGFMTYQYIKTTNKMLATEKETLNDDYDSKIKEQVEIAISMIDEIDKKTQTGELTIDEAKKESARFIKKFEVWKGRIFLG